MLLPRTELSIAHSARPWLRLFPFGPPQYYGPSSLLFAQQGDATHDFWLLASGAVALTFCSENGESVALRVCLPVSLVTCAPLNRECAHLFSALTLTKTVLHRAPATDVLRQIGCDPAAARLFQACVVDELRAFATAAIDLKCLTTAERLFKLLAVMAAVEERKSPEGWCIVNSVSEAELAFLLGVEPSNFSRAKRELFRSGRLIQRGKTFIIPDHGRTSD